MQINSVGENDFFSLSKIIGEFSQGFIWMFLAQVLAH